VILQDGQPEPLSQASHLVLAHLPVVMASVEVLERGNTRPLQMVAPNDSLDVRVRALAHGQTIPGAFRVSTRLPRGNPQSIYDLAERPIGSQNFLQSATSLSLPTRNVGRKQVEQRDGEECEANAERHPNP
jgi:hypothetical protein